MGSGRKLFEQFINQEPLTRPAFIPMIRGLLSRVEGKPMETLTTDTTLWTNSLAKTSELFGFDGVVAGVDSSLAAEACGCNVSWEDDRPMILPLQGSINKEPQQSQRMQQALEVTNRLFSICQQNLTCVTALTGPFTLASQLFGTDEGPEHMQDVKPLIVQLTKAFCETKPDVLIFFEGQSLSLAKIDTSHRRIYNTLKNIAAYFDIPVGLYLKDYRSDNISDFSKLNMDLYILGPSLNRNMLRPSDLWHLGKGSLGLGLGLPLNDIEAAREFMHEGLRLYHDQAEHGLFFTSFEPVTRNINLENIHALMNELSKL
jgi:hypothetical protein